MHEVHGNAVGGDPAFAEGRVLLLNAGGQRHSYNSALPYLTAKIKT